MVVESLAGVFVCVCAAEGPKLDSERAATDIIGEALGVRGRVVVIPVERLGPGFLTLSTRIAGEAIQKFEGACEFVRSKMKASA